MSNNDKSGIQIVHYADPWCWYSWGLEPVLQRLHEVYGDDLEIVYRMGGVFNNMKEWMNNYGIEDNAALLEWIKENYEVMKNPFNMDYLVSSGVESTWPACVAVKAAELQSKKKAERFYRRLMETIQLKAENGSLPTILKKVAEDSGLDPARFLVDAGSEEVKKMFEDDVKMMKDDGGNFYSLLIINKTNGERKIIEGYSSYSYEREIDAMSNGQLQKKTPLDILEYMDRRRGFFITSHEIGEVFKIDDNEAEERLRALTNEGLLQEVAANGSGTYWKFQIGLDVPKLTIKQVELSHVTAKSRVSDQDDLGRIVTKSVKKLYTEVAEKPEKEFHFLLGREAATYVGYSKDELESIPETAVESFAGVGYPFAAKVINQGNTVLDIGSGSGTDILVSALKVGTKGKVYGLDFTDSMISKAEKNIEKSGFKNVKILRGNASSIPLPDSSIDVVTSNGVINLVPNKKKVFQEILRVIKDGGSLQLADIVVQKDVQKTCGLVPQLWADCIGGAAVQSSYLQMLTDAGFNDVKIISKMDYFAKSNSDSTKRLTKTFGAESIVISAKKPDRLS